MAARKEKRRIAHAKRGRGEGDGGKEEEEEEEAMKQKARVASGWCCPECGEEFASRNAFGRHCGETGHRKS